MNDRRFFFRKALGIGAGAVSASLKAQGSAASHTVQRFAAPVAVETPDIPDLPFTVDHGVKVFHLVAEPVRQRITPDKTIDVWGFNGSAPGPTIQITQGDRVRLVVDNHLPEPTSMHWHGFEIPNGMDGGPGVSQDPIQPGGRFVYEFTLDQAGTFFYHSHMAMQEMFGMLGAFIMHPKNAYQPRVDKDFVYMLQEYAVLPNNSIPNSMNMEFNWLVLNGKAGPATTPMIVRLGDRVRIRLINLGMDHHPMHLHGHTFEVTGTEAGRIQESAWIRGNTILVGVAQARDIEFVAKNAGDWMFHCHMPHHMMNQMSSNVGAMTRGAGEANRVPGFPQDAYMEGPMMAMDAMVSKPQNFGLRAGWSGFMQGMMTFVRVLPPDRYEEIVQKMREGGAVNMPGMQHPM